MKLCVLPLLGLAAIMTACSAPAGGTEDATAPLSERTEIPTYSGDGFTGARILRLSDGAWLTDRELVDALGRADVAIFGEQHLTAPVQALETWLLGKMVASVPDLGLAMEHFQRDEQPVIDKYFAGEIDQATFEAQAQVWPGYQQYWRQVVEVAHAAHRPLLGLNVPKETLNDLYAQFPTWPLDAFDAIPSDGALASSLPARPLPAWSTIYQGWFETSFDYAAHGQGMGLSYADALHYFTDLAQIRDETMANWVARGLEERAPHLLVVAGDWHVQTRLAVPDRVARMKPAAKIATITTTPADKLDELRAFSYQGRAAADYVIAYTPPAPPPTP
jgi:uncharacterized iron-regulated protein